MRESKKKSGSVRVIAGKWRRRRIAFDSALEIRPTTDAVRESLFNWLQAHIEGSSCLDLYAGSGALGFEALSRGAAQAVLVDSNHRCVRNLNWNAAQLGAQHCTIVHCDALAFLRRVDRPFDIIFIDPPFRTGLARRTLQLLQSTVALHADSYVYLEAEREFDMASLADSWQILRCTNAGSRAHYLLVPNQAKD